MHVEHRLAFAGGGEGTDYLLDLIHERAIIGPAWTSIIEE